MKLFKHQEPKKKTNNIIYNCPHSGEKFPDGFFDTVNISKDILLSSGDSFVDRLFDDCTDNGSVLFANLYARSFIDTNREAFELDPAMFSGNITEELNESSNKVRLGFGSIAKYAVNRENIYKEKIPFSDALKRIDQYYFPIHEKLNGILATEYKKFGYALLVDCHSMPSYKFLGQLDLRNNQPDIIIGDLFGKSCHPAISHYLYNHFKKHGLSVASNAPFAGGYNTRHYSAPESGKHSIQIEIKKSLYMDEFTRKPNENFKAIKSIMDDLCAHLNKDIDDLLK